VEARVQHRFQPHIDHVHHRSQLPAARGLDKSTESKLGRARTTLPLVLNVWTIRWSGGKTRVYAYGIGESKDHMEKNGGYVTRRIDCNEENAHHERKQAGTC